MTQRLSKTDFLQYLHCPKSLWLSRHKPHLVPASKQDAHAALTQKQGYEVEAAIEAWLGTKNYTSQVVFEASNGAYARTDLVQVHTDQSLDLIEVKGGVSLKQSHIYDVAFQTCVAEMAGQVVRSQYVAQIQKGYVEGAQDVPFVLKDVSDQVGVILSDVRRQIILALELINLAKIDESSCSCLTLSRRNQCASFAYFNPDIPTPSIYSLPRMTQKKLAGFVEDARFNLADIHPNEVSKSQQKALWAAQNNQPFVDHDYIDQFLAGMTFPLYFYDYEAFATPLPTLAGTRPYQQIPFQFSLHILEEDGQMRHVEFLAEDWELPRPLLDHLNANIAASGTVVSWNKSYENARNDDMGGLYPSFAAFLDNVTERTVDLQDIFKHGYVDAGFGGSTSIKNVLPVMVPDLSYDDLPVGNGGEAMVAFARMIALPNGAEKDALRRDMLAYCALDSFAMVRIYQEILRLQAGRKPRI